MKERTPPKPVSRYWYYVAGLSHGFFLYAVIAYVLKRYLVG